MHSARSGSWTRGIRRWLLNLMYLALVEGKESLNCRELMGSDILKQVVSGSSLCRGLTLDSRNHCLGIIWHYSACWWSHRQTYNPRRKVHSSTHEVSWSSEGWTIRLSFSFHFKCVVIQNHLRAWLSCAEECWTGSSTGGIEVRWFIFISANTRSYEHVKDKNSIL